MLSFVPYVHPSTQIVVIFPFSKIMHQYLVLFIQLYKIRILPFERVCGSIDLTGSLTSPMRQFESVSQFRYEYFIDGRTILLQHRESPLFRPIRRILAIRGNAYRYGAMCNLSFAVIGSYIFSIVLITPNGTIIITTVLLG